MTTPLHDPALATRISRLLPFLHDLESPDGVNKESFVTRFFEEAHTAGWVLPDFRSRQPLLRRPSFSQGQCQGRRDAHQH